MLLCGSGLSEGSGWRGLVNGSEQVGGLCRHRVMAGPWKGWWQVGKGQRQGTLRGGDGPGVQGWGGGGGAGEQAVAGLPGSSQVSVNE